MHRSLSIVLIVSVLTACNIFLGAAGELDAPCINDTDCNQGLACVDKRCKEQPLPNWQLLAGDQMMTWPEADQYCRDFQIEGDSRRDWRLPSIDELRSLVMGCSGTEPEGVCGIHDGCVSIDPDVPGYCMDVDCEGCTAGAGLTDRCYWLSGLEGPCEGASYWSSTPFEDDAENHWSLFFELASIHTKWDGEGNYVRCIHDPT